MPVTRVEGPRPLEAATNVAPHKSRTGDTSAKPTHVERSAAPGDEEKPEPVSIFKPYSLTFRYEKELHRVVVKVIDPATGELLREIPPETVIEALKRLRTAPGALVDEEV